jgi:hypothetical protein
MVPTNKQKSIAKTDLIDLDECVINALELFERKTLKPLTLPRMRRPLVLGSGNAAITGKILFEDMDAVFADESNYKEILKSHTVDHAIIISASGGKHAPILAQDLEKREIPTTLLTCNPDAPARSFVTDDFVSPKNAEPYTYNTSTYLGMILRMTKENPTRIKEYLSQEINIPDLKAYTAFYIILPNEFGLLREMFLTKFDELFGPVINGRVYTVDQTKHAKTIVPSEKELFIGLGYENTTWGTHRINVVPDRIGYGTLLSIGYFIIGHIQKQHPDYFKDNIIRYTKEASELFGEHIEPIVR